MDPSLELRMLPVGFKYELASILEFQKCWRKLMGVIPKILYTNNYKCDVDWNNPPKYRSEHFRIIEDHSIKYKVKCSEILLLEWGTSGKIRPTLGHLTYLLEKAELYRAADYVTGYILKQDTPKRPERGPSAPVILNLNELKDIHTEDEELNLPDLSQLIN